jgi:subtilisin
MPKPQRYLILPIRGLQATPATASVHSFLTGLVSAAAARPLRSRLFETVAAGAAALPRNARSVKPKVTAEAFQLVSSMQENGVKLVSATPEMAAAIRYEQPGLRVVPEIFYRPARFELRLRSKAARALAGRAAVQRKLEVTVVRADTGDPVAGVDVIGFTDFAAREGNQGLTKANGKVTLTAPGSAKTYERLYVQHELPGLWSFLANKVDTKGNLQVALRPLDLAAGDSLRHFHDIGADGAGTGVRVGVIDSGVALSHPDLVVSGGFGCVPDEPETDWGPTGGSHGSHVAGTIAGRGAAPTGVRGIAPGVELFSYRVFGQTESSGSNFAIVKAVQQGIADGCHLLNMSLGFDADENTGLPQVDEAVQEALRQANERGIVVVVAAGNDGRKPVNYPAFDDLAIAVSAVGRKGTFPAESGENGDVMAPYGADPKDFVAAFSNIGTELDVTGAGVGVVSTVPPQGYAPMSGTSMACPAVTGVLARLLSENPAVLKMAPDSNRAVAIKKLLFDRAQTLGFKLELEGKGLPR